MYRLITTAQLCYYHHPAHFLQRALSTNTYNKKISKPILNSTIAPKDKISDDNKASPEQLAILSQKLTLDLPKFFTRPHDYSIYSRDVVLVDNIRNLRVQGITWYASQVLLVKLFHHVNYSASSLELLNLVKHPEESCIKIRWRIIKKPGLFYSIIFFYRLRRSNNWKDGLSTMYVNKEGKIYCHSCDNIDVETDTKVEKKIKNPVVV